MKIRKAVLLLACAVSWGIAVWFAGRLWAAYPLVSVRSDVPVTGRQLEALRSALRQEDGASALVPAFWSQAEGSAESRWETCGITAILYCGEYDAVYPAVLLEGRLLNMIRGTLSLYGIFSIGKRHVPFGRST